MKKLLFITIAIFLPNYTFAARSSGGTFDSSSLSSFVDSINDFVGFKIIPLLLTIALAVFFFRIAISIYKVGSDVKAVEEGKKLLFWGIIALFVMVSIWGLVGLLTNTIFGGTPVIPQIQGR